MTAAAALPADHALLVRRIAAGRHGPEGMRDSVCQTLGIRLRRRTALVPGSPRPELNRSDIADVRLGSLRTVSPVPDVAVLAADDVVTRIDLTDGTSVPLRVPGAPGPAHAAALHAELSAWFLRAGAGRRPGHWVVREHGAPIAGTAGAVLLGAGILCLLATWGCFMTGAITLGTGSGFFGLPGWVPWIGVLVAPLAGAWLWWPAARTPQVTLRVTRDALELIRHDGGRVPPLRIPAAEIAALRMRRGRLEVARRTAPPVSVPAVRRPLLLGDTWPTAAELLPWLEDWRSGGTAEETWLRHPPPSWRDAARADLRVLAGQPAARVRAADAAARAAGQAAWRAGWTATGAFAAVAAALAVTAVARPLLAVPAVLAGAAAVAAHRLLVRPGFTVDGDALVVVNPRRTTRIPAAEIAGLRVELCLTVDRVAGPPVTAWAVRPRWALAPGARDPWTVLEELFVWRAAHGAGRP